MPVAFQHVVCPQVVQAVWIGQKRLIAALVFPGEMCLIRVV